MINDYTVIQKVLHWLMAGIIMLDLFIAQKFGNYMEIADRLESRVDHSTMGLLVLTLFIIRLVLRMIYGAPKEDSTSPVWQVWMAKIAHGLLYVLMGLLVGSGLLTAVSATSSTEVFGIFDITLGRMNDEFFDFVRQFHEFFTEVMIVLVVIHVVAALYHQFIRRDNLLLKMLTFKRS
ncbi:hypothetical protein A9Q81_13740 [Gammaproteobacteria bacterium 42_54_T18]|nr:hypothetical protein A9Q81_13740 [Gammaproteobacteria bacterium 42_54_T18]